MIYLSAQPDSTYFIWQLEIQMLNFEDEQIDMSTVHVLVGYNGEKNIEWENVNLRGANVHFYEDTRKSRVYVSAIRPHIIAKFLKEFPEFEKEYIFYLDSDVTFNQKPNFEGMEDGRWHVSKTDYIDWNYINNKYIPTLMKDMLHVVGIDEEIVKANIENTGGAQYFMAPTNVHFWEKIERDCERMYVHYHEHLADYMEEWERNNVNRGDLVSLDVLYKADKSLVRDKKIYYNNEAFVQWYFHKQAVEPNEAKYDFQIWTTDMWCVLWNAWLLGVKTYCNPELNFSWPADDYEKYERERIFHNSGINGHDEKDFLIKGHYNSSLPYDVDVSQLGIIRFPNGEQKKAQRAYLDLLERLQKEKGTMPMNTKMEVEEYPLVSCVMTTYGRFNFVERSITLWLLQDYPNKELIILNTAATPLYLDKELRSENIKVINNIYKRNTTEEFTNVGQIRKDAISYANGEFYICWDDDDLYLPWHISQGMKVIKDNNLVAWMPQQSIWTNDGGKTYEYATNAMEASCIVHMNEIQKYGFKDGNGDEHLTWRLGLRNEGKLSENYSVTPFESYVYVWGEEGHKQSSTINKEDNFEYHKSVTTDFGDRGLKRVPLRNIWYFTTGLSKFVNNEDFTKRLESYDL